MKNSYDLIKQHIQTKYSEIITNIEYIITHFLINIH